MEKVFQLVFDAKYDGQMVTWYAYDEVEAIRRASVYIQDIGITSAICLGYIKRDVWMECKGLHTMSDSSYKILDTFYNTLPKYINSNQANAMLQLATTLE